MKLPMTPISAIDALLEFDVWLTPTLGEIRDTERFQKEMDSDKNESHKTVSLGQLL